MSDAVPYLSRRERRAMAERTLREQRSASAPTMPALMEPSPTAYAATPAPPSPLPVGHSPASHVSDVAPAAEPVQLELPDLSAPPVEVSAPTPPIFDIEAVAVATPPHPGILSEADIDSAAPGAVAPEPLPEAPAEPLPHELSAPAQWDLPDEPPLVLGEPAVASWDSAWEQTHTADEADDADVQPPVEMDHPSLDPVEAEPVKRRRKRGVKRPWWRHIVDFVVIAVGAALVAVLLKSVAFRTFEVPSESMNPTLMTNDRMVVELVSHHFDPYKRGDVVVFRDVDDWVGDGLGSGEAPNALQLLGILPESTGYVVKRVLATPGETIEGLGDGTLLVNGKEIKDPYAPRTAQEPFTWTLSDGEYWMMGDNRAGSADSRMHGPVSEENMVGRAAFTFFPFDRAGAID